GWQEAVQGLAGVIETSPGREVGQLRLGMNAYLRRTTRLSNPWGAVAHGGFCWGWADCHWPAYDHPGKREDKIELTTSNELIT
ncbi:hypothetical protein ACQKE4_20385, partial [Halomonas sp. NPDC076908]|uniref:hypothetical protein n=1 Tax=Halomonas sp. NPDC076908 TaxID=3390567 RepID=UPI003D04B6E2